MPENWQANGISYGPYRDGQGPDLGEPTKEQVAEDLRDPRRRRLADDSTLWNRAFCQENL